VRADLKLQFPEVSDQIRFRLNDEVTAALPTRASHAT
jgi:hypothetical protein